MEEIHVEPQQELEGICVLSHFHSKQLDLCLTCMELVVELQISSLRDMV